MLVNLLKGHLDDWNYNNQMWIEASPNTTFKNVPGQETPLHLRITRAPSVTYSLNVQAIDPTSIQGFPGYKIADNTGSLTGNTLGAITHSAVDSVFNSLDQAGNFVAFDQDASQYYLN